jgi:CheY-like chemotaxis protein
MNAKKVLVIDDSATIRRLADSYLGPAGYEVSLAASAEEGLRLTREIRPDLILLDHQLPGTTGYQVCCELQEDTGLRTIPVVISSTLRKKAYVEYTDLPNVVDMLPKPYTEELLTTTVRNALDTGALIVESQTQGTAVPEVIEQPGESALYGNFEHFRLRQVLDFLNNAEQDGVLEIEGERHRTSVYLGGGHVQGVTASGFDPSVLASQLPDTLRSLAPVLKLTVGGRSAAELDGIVELLDRRVVDPRLLRKLLRLQAAHLIFACFTQRLKEFRFDAGRTAPPIVQKLPLDVSVLALLVEGALSARESESPAVDDGQLFARRAIRGQNLDRAGLAAKHIKLLGLLGQPLTAAELAGRLGCDHGEVSRVLQGLLVAEVVELRDGRASQSVIVYETDPELTVQTRRLLGQCNQDLSGHFVQDRLTLHLMLQRSRPAAILYNLDDDTAAQTIRMLRERRQLDGIKLIGTSANTAPPAGDLQLDQFLPRPFNSKHLEAALHAALGETGHASAATAHTLPVAGHAQLEPCGGVA